MTPVTGVNIFVTANFMITLVDPALLGHSSSGMCNIFKPWTVKNNKIVIKP